MSKETDSTNVKTFTPVTGTVSNKAMTKAIDAERKRLKIGKYSDGN